MKWIAQTLDSDGEFIREIVVPANDQMTAMQMIVAEMCSEERFLSIPVSM